jgi:putative oxygen-independent coproporphyrinogen III oxidase
VLGRPLRRRNGTGNLRSVDPIVDPVPFGVYVHIPFCARRCDYCAFATWTDKGHMVDAYLDALRVEIGRAVTVECNPDTVSDPLLSTYRAGGVSRLSFGVQSLVDHVLVGLGRTHDVANVERAVQSARRVGFDSFNLDLIYGGAGESAGDWQMTLDRLLQLDPPHVSAYALTIEAGTPLAADPARHPDDDDQADKYLLAEAVLGAAGYDWYEISNWAQPGYRCQHNLLYWRQGDYRGFGCAAHSHRAGRRWWNLRTPDRYVDALAEHGSTEGGFEVLDQESRRIEGLQLALRMVDGVPGEALVDDPDIEDLIERRDGRARLTVSGRLLANEVAIRLR